MLEETLELIEETRKIENAFAELNTSELEELRKDHMLTGRISECKNALQEIENFDIKIERLHSLLENSEEIENIAEQISNMKRSLKFFDNSPQFSSYSEKIESFTVKIKHKLKQKTELMGKSESRDELKKLVKVYKDMEIEMEFAQILVGIRLHYNFSNAYEDFEEYIADLLQRLRKEGSLFQYLFEDPSPYLETLFEQILSNEKISSLFLERNLDSLITTYNCLLSLISYIKNATNSLTPISNHILMISLNLLDLEKNVFSVTSIPRINKENPIEN